jgi:hypothetical protein
MTLRSNGFAGKSLTNGSAGSAAIQPDKRIDWIPEQTRAMYWVNDVMFNAMHSHGMHTLSDIATILSLAADDAQQQERYAQDTLTYQKLAEDSAHEILDRMWDAKTGFFYNLDMHGQQIPVKSITGLFPLILKGIGHHQATALIEKLEDETWFNTPFPIPTHAVCSEFFDPEPSGFKNAATPQWSGTVWKDMNHILDEQGIVPRIIDFTNAKHDSYDPVLAGRALKLGMHIAAKSRELLAGNAACMEYYGAISGTGMRVEHFMWSNLGLHFEKLGRLATFTYMPEEAA